MHGDLQRPWIDQNAQHVRPYMVVAGHARDRYALRLDTVLTATHTAHAASLEPEAAHAVELCRAGGCSVAEIAGTIDQPILVTKTILSDLIDARALVIVSPAAPPDLGSGRPGAHLLQALLEGLEAHDVAVA